MLDLFYIVTFLTSLQLSWAQSPMKNHTKLQNWIQVENGRKNAFNLVNNIDTRGLTEWTSWFNIDHPGGNGDYERLEAIQFYYRERMCANPVAIEVRTTEWLTPAEAGEVVHYSLQKGFWCINKEQPDGKACSNYHVRFQCPLDWDYWSNWSGWSACSETTCGGAGIQTRNRTCLSTNTFKPTRVPKCHGHYIQRQECSTAPCPDAKWSEWGPWGPCSVKCGGGFQTRRRRCMKFMSSQTCLGKGRPVEVQACSRTPCPTACQLICAKGRVNDDCTGCICDDHVLMGLVLTHEGGPIAAARVSMENRPGVTLARTDDKGSFHVSGVCLDKEFNVTIVREKYAPGRFPATSNGTSVFVVHAVLGRVEKPYITSHPESKTRMEGQRVTLCCKASGNPEPDKYYWYHNGTLLDRKIYNYDENLILKQLKSWQRGEYICKASNEIGVIKSSPAYLTVLASGEQICDSKPESHLIKLPIDCFQTATNSFYYNVGKCSNKRCAGELDYDLRCKDTTEFCCGVARMTMQEVQCQGYVLPVKVVDQCGCEKCVLPKILLRGRVIAADDGEPLRFGHVFVDNEQVAITGFKGAFTIQVPPDTERLVVKFVDREEKFVETIKVFPFDRKGGDVYHTVSVMRKKEPIDLDASKTNTILLGEKEGDGPMGEMVLPSGTFRRPSGEIYNGTVKASVTFLDPRDITTAAAAPSDLNFVDNEGDILPLRTYGMFSVDFREEASKEVLEANNVEVRMDVEQIKMPEHIEKMKLWSLNPDTGLWEEESEFQFIKSKRKKREERVFLIGNMEIRERRMFNLDVPENRRCYVKVRAYMNEKFLPHEQLQGIVISLINLEPKPGYTANPRAWGRFDSVITGPNGACLPAFCDAQKPDAYTAYVTATLGGEELEPPESSPKLNPNVIGVSQPYLHKLGYRRTDHDDLSLKKTAFKINLAKPNPNNIDETDGPIYAYRNVKDCENAPVSANHFRFYRVEGHKYEYNVIPFQENDLTSWTGDYLSWWPNPQEFRACYIKVKINGPHEYMVRSINDGGTHYRTKGQLYGIRDIRTVNDMRIPNISTACLEFKCSGMLFDQNIVDRTSVSVMPQGSCRRTGINSLFQEYLFKHPPQMTNNDSALFNMLAPVDPLGHNYGIYTVTDQNPRLAKEIAIGRCFDGTSDGFSREMKADRGIAVTFTCREKPATQETLFQRLQNSPLLTLSQVGRDMRENGQLQGRPSQIVAYPSVRRGQTRRVFTSRRRPGMLRRQAQ
ncbi:cartilage intermediate layer protein 1-like isoform X2 [Protopterus annectens]|uniref:cartilage intermediate layer protein 1-like isoform X2 n=1 Tax=Protopterus annectens TaxID=7888 RepID=UPI001CFB5170|nr:cartilage intermediate layer protein 1-like isoform X2 [Protopterus annectens]